MKELHQREILAKSSILASSSVLLSNAPRTQAASQSAPVASSNNLSFETVEELSTFISKYCKTMVKAVNQSGKLLYRGEPLVSNKGLLLLSKSDLTKAETYDSYAAADFFAAFSNYTLGIYQGGHIGVSNQIAASAWGGVASIWPLDNPKTKSFKYCWLKQNKEFWQNEWNAPQSAESIASGGPFFWKDLEKMNSYMTSRNADIVLDKDLDNALSSEHEILFSSNFDRKEFASLSNSKDSDLPSEAVLADSSLYVAVPLLLESKLLAALDVKPKEDTIKPSKVVLPEDSIVDSEADIKRTRYGRRVNYPQNL
jgi:hypothetical protein